MAAFVILNLTSHGTLTRSFPMATLRQIIAKFLEGVRTENAVGGPLYCVRDIAAKLVLTRGGIMATAWRLPDQYKAHRLIKTGRGLQMHLFVSETGFLRLAMAGRTLASRKFRKMVSNLDLTPDLLPQEASLVYASTPAEVLSLEPEDRRNHILLWLAITAAIARSPRHHETILEVVADNRTRGGVSSASCYRYFRLWADSGGDWRVFDRWASLRRSARNT
jgi:hypothetical protein